MDLSGHFNWLSRSTLFHGSLLRWIYLGIRRHRVSPLEGYLGRVVLYYWNGSSWINRETIVFPFVSAAQQFGCSVSFQGPLNSRLVVGMCNGIGGQGAISYWTQVVKNGISRWVPYGAPFTVFGISNDITPLTLGFNVLAQSSNSCDVILSGVPSIPAQNDGFVQTYRANTPAICAPPTMPVTPALQAMPTPRTFAAVTGTVSTALAWSRDEFYWSPLHRYNDGNGEHDRLWILLCV